MNASLKTSAPSRVREAQQYLTGRVDVRRAEAAYRQALKADPLSSEAAAGLADLLRGLGRGGEALAITAPFVARVPAAHAALAAHAQTLMVLGRSEEALSAYRRAAEENPKSAIASHNLAGAFGNLSQFEAAASFARKALSAGLDAPETWLVLARALQGLGRLEESQSGYYEALTRNPRHGDAQRELAQLIWMRTGDVKEAIKPLDIALVTGGPDPRLLEVRAIALKFCGDIPGAYETAMQDAVLFPGDAAVRVGVAHLAILSGHPAEGLAHARAAVAAQPASLWTRLAVCEALLALGEASKAAPLIGQLRAEAPLDQNVIAYQGTAWRLLGDERYHALYDYDDLVSTSLLDTPDGWSRLDDYLADLAAALARAHLFRAHPFQQSLLNGSQAPDLMASNDPAIRGFLQAVAGPIERRLAALGQGSDLVRARNTGQSRLQGLWSVRLNGGGGRHVSHVHHKGWLSSACHIVLPAGIAASPERAGWLTFGEPGIATALPLPAEHFVKPQPGRLVLFPSYMWHGTEPFAGDGVRLSVAFDLLPA